MARHLLDVVRVGIPGFDLVVLCPEGPLVARLREAGARVAVGRLGPSAGLLRSIRTLRAAAARLRPDVVHSHLAYADIVVAATPLPKGTVRVTTEHGIAGDDSVYHSSSAKARLMASVHRARLARFDGAIAVAEATKQAMLAKWAPSLEIEVVHNGVDPLRGHRHRSSAAGTRELRILALARLSPEKRIDQLIAAFARVHAVRPDAHLTVAGVGDLEQALRRQAQSLGLEKAIDFPGFVDPDEAMAQADVLAQLSIWENCSYSLLDAANRGMRVVASRVGGNPEIVTEQALVDADDVQAIADALLDESAMTNLTAWPTVAHMNAEIARVYLAAGAPSGRGTVSRVTIATNNGDIGGGEVMLLNIAETLSSLGVDVTIVGPREPGDLVATARREGYDVVELDASGRREWMRALREWDAQHRQGVLWCNGLVPAVATAGHRDRIVHLHQRPQGVQKALETIARPGALTTIVPSRSMAEAIRGARVLPNWSHAAPRAAHREPDDKIVLGFLGRPSTDKGVDVLARALSVLEARTPGRYRLLLAGEPRFVSAESQRLVEAALQPVAHLLDRPGWIDPADFFAKIDLLIVPSVWPEPFGLVATEAMSVGMPLLVSDAGALAEIVPPETGDVFPAGDERVLADAIEAKVARGLDTNISTLQRIWEQRYSPAAGRRSVQLLLASLPSSARG
ncbi:glycosyltransferase family 4 protein [Pseudoclavibacter sp. RFBA6]|uniref:glycosyltransferase family 4 protein n=1 Tax=Pseudoclavibacter sp. RFBA6 TaxID=2080573 RepID=UPI0021572D12|nr:glycosyltransferase family 4 protein [Pseudoclavibacter sp. RFBA6]